MSWITALTGGLLGLAGLNETKDQNQVSEQLAREQMALQKEFAQKGIQWRVDDAKAAGLHPIYALGGSAANYSPVSASFAGTGGSYAQIADSISDWSSARRNALPSGAVTFPAGSPVPHYERNGKTVPMSPEQAAAYYSLSEAQARTGLLREEAASLRRQASQPGFSVGPTQDELNRAQQMQNLAESVEVGPGHKLRVLGIDLDVPPWLQSAEYGENLANEPGGWAQGVGNIVEIIEWNTGTGRLNATARRVLSIWLDSLK